VPRAQCAAACRFGGTSIMSSISFGVPLSGLALQQSRLAGSASNVANINSEPATEDRDGFVPTRVTGVTGEDGGVRAEQRPITPPTRPVYDPTAANADENGIAERPNVDLAEEAVVQIQSKVAFEANLKALEAQDEQLGSLLDLTS
jgi:flagellar basal body rod protein FlgC